MKQTLLYEDSRYGLGLCISWYDVYDLDYRITTGTEAAVVDILQKIYHPVFGAGDTHIVGWAPAYGWTIGYGWDGQLTFVENRYDGNILRLQVDENTWNTKMFNRRNLYTYGNGFVRVSETSGGWEEGPVLGSATGSTANWSRIIGEGIHVKGTGYVNWRYYFFGLRIYDTGTPTSLGNLVAEYIPQQRNGVWGIYNTVSGNFITKTEE